MKKVEKTNGKATYSPPVLTNIVLDNEISLILASNPPGGPGEGAVLQPELLKNDPFKNGMA